MNKAKALAAIEGLPEEFKLDDLIEKLVLIEKVEAARQQVREGKTKTNEEVKKLMKEWQQ